MCKTHERMERAEPRVGVVGKTSILESVKKTSAFGVLFENYNTIFEAVTFAQSLYSRHYKVF